MDEEKYAHNLSMRIVLRHPGIFGGSGGALSWLLCASMKTATKSRPRGRAINIYLADATLRKFEALRVKRGATWGGTIEFLLACREEALREAAKKR